MARVEWIEAGLGSRRFARVTLEAGTPRTLVARIDAPEDPRGRPHGASEEPPLEPIRSWLETHGVPVPARLGADPASGIELLEDLGELSLARAWQAAEPHERRRLYEEACDLVPRIQGVPAGPAEAFGRRLDAALFAYKAELFVCHALEARGRPATPAEAACVRDAFASIARTCERAPQRLAHRDLQSANVLVRPDAPAGARLSLIDLQGAFLAPPEYDLVCLLRDSYVEHSAEEVEHQLRRIRGRLPDPPDADRFAERFDLLTLSRKGKDLARFHQAAAERGDERFLRHVPATVRALRAAAPRAAARNPALAPFAALLAELPCAP